MIRVTDDITLDDREVDERFVRAIGPGGQNARREATAVELRFDIGASALPRDAKNRLMDLGGRSITNDGVLVMVGRTHRSQAENREAVRARFIALLRRAAKPPVKRRPTSPRRAVREERLGAKKRRGTVKQLRSRRRPRED